MRTLITLLTLLAVTAHAQQVETEQPAKTFQFSVWKKCLTSKAFTNSRFRVKSEAYKQTPNDKGGRGPRVGVTYYDIFRSEDLCRTLQVGVDDKRGLKLVLEQCFTDQYLNLQGNNYSDPKREPVLRASGCLEREPQNHPTDMIGPTTLIFGVVNFAGDWDPRIANFDDSLEAKKPTAIDCGPIGTIRVTVEEGAPSEIEHRFQSIANLNGKIDFAKRDPAQSQILRYSKIVWKSVDTGFIPVSYVFDQFEEAKGAPVLLQHVVVTVEEYELNKEYLNDDLFLPTNIIKDGTEVYTGYDFRCEWRDDRIQPILTK
jgi:hypothetical protein